LSTEALDNYLVTELDKLRSQGLFRRLAVVEGPTGARACINEKEVINLASNNYLGLAGHPALREASVRAIDRYGVGSGAVRTIVGTMAIHEELESRLAAFKGTEAALVFTSGFTANAGVLGTVLAEGDLVVSDELNHASIIDGVRLTKAARAVYRHADMGDLRRALAENHGKFQKTLIVTDGVFSMDGDIAPLDKIADLANEFGAITMVDDAHGSGVTGDHGRGTVSHFGIPHDRWDITVGTLSKAVGVVGGYVACSSRLRRLMEHRARPFLFSTSLPPMTAAAAIAAINVIDSQEGERLIERMWENARTFKAKLASAGFDTGISQTPITPVIIGDAATTMRFSDALFARGVYATGIAFPTVAKDRARVRTIVTAGHTQEDLNEAAEAFVQVGAELGVLAG
jgi:glycine C-acetyltransferase